MNAPKQQDKAKLLRKIPKNAKRVKVIDAKNREAWRKIPVEGDYSLILDTDHLMIDPSTGAPFFMIKNPGRPAKIPKQNAVNTTVAEIVARRKDSIKKDKLLQKVNTDVESDDVLSIIMEGFAHEAAALKFEREQTELEGKPTSQLSIRRINALKAVADTWLKRKDQISNRSIDLNSIAFQRLFSFIVNTFRETLGQNLSEDQIGVIMTALSDRLGDDTWEEEARIAMRGE